jgi:hypothetical protein
VRREGPIAPGQAFSIVFAARSPASGGAPVPERA